MAPVLLPAAGMTSRHTSFNDVQDTYKRVGFSSMRGIQEAAIEPMLQGKNCLLIAPTSGGKTEAAVLPAFTLIHNCRANPVSIIYLAPMRALLNDLYPRLTQMAKACGFSASKWHSDVELKTRHRFIQSPDDLLLTTPESLEALFLFRHAWCVKYLSNVRMVVIDELHVFACNDRGAHLFGLMERLKAFYCGDFQRIALSATVGNPKKLIAALGKGSDRKRAHICLPQTATQSEIVIRYAKEDAAFQSSLADLCRASKQLIFTDSRQSVEDAATTLQKNGTRTLVTHSSLPTAHREASEQTFRKDERLSMVSTCVLEMGIDIGDLENIIQINAPLSVNSFHQRLGRAGRRHGRRRRFTFVCRHQLALLQATAVTHLHQAGFIDPVVPLTTAAHILAQQLLSMAFSQQHLTVRQALKTVASAESFSNLNNKSHRALVAFMQQEGLLQRSSTLKPGPKAHRLFEGPKKRSLCSDFQTPAEYIVLHATTEIGRLDVLFVWGKKAGEFRFTLGGRHWLAMEIDHAQRIIKTLPVRKAPGAVWTGNGPPLSYAICQEMQKILLSRSSSPFWKPSAAHEMMKMRDNYAFLREDTLALRRIVKNKWHLYTFAGGKANALIAAFLQSTENISTVHSNLGVTFPDLQKLDHLVNVLKKIRINVNSLMSPATFQNLPVPNTVSKFDYCLPPQLKQAALAEQLFDIASAKTILKKKVHIV